MKKITLGFLLAWAVGCSNGEDPSEANGEEGAATCLGYDAASARIFADLLSEHQACADQEDCSIRTFTLTCGNESTFGTCPVAVASRQEADLERSWNARAESLCAEMRDSNMQCIAVASCLSPLDRAQCVAGRCAVEYATGE